MKLSATIVSQDPAEIRVFWEGECIASFRREPMGVLATYHKCEVNMPTRFHHMLSRRIYGDLCRNIIREMLNGVAFDPETDIVLINHWVRAQSPMFGETEKLMLANRVQYNEDLGAME